MIAEMQQSVLQACTKQAGFECSDLGLGQAHMPISDDHSMTGGAP
jgi:hypothetical protein